MKGITLTLPGSIGTDPEVFLRKDGRIVPSSVLIPEGGIYLLSIKSSNHTSPSCSCHPSTAGLRLNAVHSGSKLVRDGVQVEIQPEALMCRQSFSDQLLSLVVSLQILSKAQGLEVSWDRIIELTDEEWDFLGPQDKLLGCQPSLNIYGPRPINVEEGYRVRSAGGHLHIGGPMILDYVSKIKNHAWGRFVALADLLVGIPSVLLDTSNQKLRRECYGRAGEYRIQDWGIEYRTLSNFWMWSYTLTSLVWSLMRLALAIHLGTSKIQDLYAIPDNHDKWAPDLLSRFNGEEIQSAINNSDQKRAEEIWGRVGEWLRSQTIVGSYYGMFGQKGVDTSLKALQTLSKEGIETVWPTWESGWEQFKARADQGKYSETPGWETFADQIVSGDYSLKKTA
jgi:hypothetical protein